jgi:hypothetical protein
MGWGMTGAVRACVLMVVLTASLGAAFAAWAFAPRVVGVYVMTLFLLGVVSSAVDAVRRATVTPTPPPLRDRP